MDSLVLIERLDELMAEAKPIPFTREARVDRDEVYKILDRIRTTLPVEFERARWTGREDSTEDAVEAKLSQIGASIAELRRVQHAQAERPNGPPLTAAASEQVREIMEAAERTAAELEQEAEAEARRLRAEAARDLKSAREESERLLRESRERADADAADYLRRVEEATQKMLERAAAADSEINGMIARLRGSGGSVMEDLEAIMTGLTHIEVRRNPAPAAEERKPQAPAKPSGDRVSVAAGSAPPAPAPAAPAGARGAPVSPARAPAPTPKPAAVAGPAAAPASPVAATTPVAAPPQPAGPAALARRPSGTPVEGLQDPPEPPAIKAPTSASADGDKVPVAAGAPTRPQSPPDAA